MENNIEDLKAKATCEPVQSVPKIKLHDDVLFMKHMKKIKYFWRGTNFNYPYTYVKLIPDKLLNEKE